MESNITSISCTVCGRLVQNVFIKDRVEGMASRTMGAFQESADQGCPRCKLIVDVLRYHVPEMNNKGMDERKVNLTINDRINLRIFPPIEAYRHSWAAEAGLDIWCIPGIGSPWSSLSSAPPISGDTGSDEAVACVRKWHSQCIESHNVCARSATNPSTLPTRVLQICGPNEVKLYVSRDEVANYVCLSHCWGTANIFKATLQNVGDLQDRIDWQQLPKNFQEAIDFAHRLGYSFIWIDSLCIIQNSDSDWENEGARMGSIYKNADLTLVATRSPDANGGCFATSSPYQSRIWNFTHVDGQPYQVHSRIPLHHWPFLSDVLPLQKRGWALQERLLSTRTVNFTDDELVWECMEALTCECSKIEVGQSNRGRTKAGVQAQLSEHAELEGINTQWQTIVNLYSERSLTYPSDVFPALQGLAKTVPAKMGTYLAGLWGNMLAESLSWHSISAGAHPRPDEWRAPTWSWASTTGQIFWRTRKEADTYATILSVTTFPKGNDVTAEIVSGELRLRCRCLKAKIQYGGNVRKLLDFQQCTASLSVQEDQGRLSIACVQGPSHYLRWDYGVEMTGVHQVADGSEVFLTMIEDGPRDRADTVYLIIRRTTDVNNTYERIGILGVSAWAKSFQPDHRPIHGRLDVAYAASPEMEISII